VADVDGVERIKMGKGIRFGTSGWRAIVADEFTVANIRLWRGLPLL
jgi:phosphomannomutase